MKPTVYLIRHAQSNSNVNYRVLQEKTNVGIELTSEGLKQAHETGVFLTKHLQNHHKPIKVWNSPYERTRQTAFAIKNELSLAHIDFIEEESIYLAERQFGLVDDAVDYPTSHPHEYAHYQLHTKEKKTFFARPPLGESPFDMCQRLDFFLRCVITQEPDYEHVVISHGAAIRGLIVMNEKLAYEKYLEMPNPYNASIHKLNGNYGYEGQLFAPSLISS